MDNTKIKQVLIDLKQERESMIKDHGEKLAYLDDVIIKLGKFVSQNGTAPANGAIRSHAKSVGPQKTVILLIEEVLAESEKPLNLDKIVSEVGRVRGEPVSKATISANISRHFSRAGKESRIERLGDGVYKFREVVIK